MIYHNNDSCRCAFNGFTAACVSILKQGVKNLCLERLKKTVELVFFFF